MRTKRKQEAQIHPKAHLFTDSATQQAFQCLPEKIRQFVLAEMLREGVPLKQLLESWFFVNAANN